MVDPTRSIHRRRERMVQPQLALRTTVSARRLLRLPEVLLRQPRSVLPEAEVPP